jgi:hypothetical protein
VTGSPGPCHWKFLKYLRTVDPFHPVGLELVKPQGRLGSSRRPGARRARGNWRVGRGARRHRARGRLMRNGWRVVCRS